MRSLRHERVLFLSKRTPNRGDRRVASEPWSHAASARARATDRSYRLGGNAFETRMVGGRKPARKRGFLLALLPQGTARGVRRARGPQRHGRRFAIVPSRETEPFPKLRSAAGPGSLTRVPRSVFAELASAVGGVQCAISSLDEGRHLFGHHARVFGAYQAPETAVGPCKLHVPVFTLRVSSAGRCSMASGRTRIFPSSDGWLKPYLEQMYGQAQQAKREALDKPGVMCTIAPKQLVELICGAQSRIPRWSSMLRSRALVIWRRG